MHFMICLNFIFEENRSIFFMRLCSRTLTKETTCGVNFCVSDFPYVSISFTNGRSSCRSRIEPHKQTVHGEDRGFVDGLI